MKRTKREMALDKKRNATQKKNQQKRILEYKKFMKMLEEKHISETFID